MVDRVKQIRNSIENKLDALEARAEALSAQFSLSREKRAQRVEERKRALRDALDHLRAELRHQQGLAPERRKQLARAIGDLRVQAALGKMEAGDAWEAERKRTEALVQRFETRIDRLLAEAEPKLNAAAEATIQKYLQARGRLLAELEAAAARVKQEANYSGAALERRRKKLASKIAKLQQQVSEQRKRVGAKLKRFEEDMKSSLKQMGTAFRNFLT